MVSLEKSTVKTAGAALLSPMAVLMQVLPPVFFTPWFTRVDFVAVPWVLCWVVFGFKASILCLLISAPLIGIFYPLHGGWVGATMRLVASVWVVINFPIFLSSPFLALGVFNHEI